MQTAFRVTYALRSAQHVGTVQIGARELKCREVRAIIAERIKAQEDDVALFFGGSKVPISLDEPIQANMMLEVERGALTTAPPPNGRPMRTQREPRPNALIPRAAAADAHSAPMSRGSGEDDMILQMQSDVAMATGVDATQRRRPIGDGPNRPAGPMREPPKGYICHNCGKGGHHIQDCPEAMKMKKFQSTAGIPESMLEPCDASDPRARFVTRSGVICRRKVFSAADEHDRFLYTQQTEEAEGVVPNTTEVPPSLLCKICTKVLVKAVKTPCCSESCCESCLLNGDLAASGDPDGPPLCRVCDEVLMVDDVVEDMNARRELEELSRKRPRTE